MVFSKQRWFGAYNSLNFHNLDPIKIDNLIDNHGNIRVPCVFELVIDRREKDNFWGYIRDILGIANIAGYITEPTPHLQAMLFTQEYSKKARENGATKNILVCKAVITPARLYGIGFTEHQQLAIGIRTGREDLEGKAIVETFIMRKGY